jgi:hypothetical protein
MIVNSGASTKTSSRFAEAPVFQIIDEVFLLLSKRSAKVKFVFFRIAVKGVVK